MLQFLNPTFLIAGSAAVVPLVLHLIQRSRTIRVRFSTVRFLKLAERRSSRRIRLENFLLWFMRTALMLLLVAAFAVPMVRSKGAGRFFTRAPRDVAIVLDGSYSMNYVAGSATVWDKAVQAAIAVVSGLDEGDQVCVFLADEDVTPVVEQLTQDKDLAIAQIKGLQTRPTPSQLGPATIAACAALKQETRRREREVHIITDGQALPWTSFARAAAGGAAATGTAAVAAAPAGTNAALAAAAPAGPATNAAAAAAGPELWRPESVDARTAFFVTLAGVSDPENAAPLDVEVEPQLIMSDMPAKVVARLSRRGALQDISLVLSIGGAEVARRAALVGEGSPERLELAVPPQAPGTHAARVETPADNLPDDNALHFLVRVREKLPSLCVGSEEASFFLMKALTARVGEQSAMTVKRVGLADLAAEDLLGYACVFLCEAFSLDGPQIQAVERYVESGGLLVGFPGDVPGADLGGAGDKWRCLPGRPAAVADIAVDARKQTLRWSNPQHALFRTLKVGPEDAPVVTLRRCLTWERFDKTAEVLMQAGADRPFLAVRPFGRGQVLFFSVTADRSWSSLPLSPFYLPISHQIVQYGAGLSGARPCLPIARALALNDPVPEATPESVLTGPDQKRIPIRSTMVDGKAVLMAENLMQPGIYTLAAADGANPRPVLALNIDRSESDLTPIPPKDIPARLGVKTLQVAVGKEELLQRIEDHRVGRTLAEQALWAAFLLALLEVLYANRKAKGGRSLLQTLGLDLSGRVRAKTAAAKG